MILYDTASDAMRRILYSLGYMEFLKSRNMDVEKAYLLQLLSHGKPSMKKFFLRLEELHQIISEGRHRHAESTVTLSTIHGSKGLEYDQVFILDALEHILPSVREEGFLTEVQYMEERRLYYVAMTRARNQLTIFSYGHETSPFTMEVFGHPMDSAKKKAMKFHFAKEGITNKNAIEKAEPKMDLSSYTVGTAIHHKKIWRREHYSYFRNPGTGTVLPKWYQNLVFAGLTAAEIAAIENAGYCRHNQKGTGSLRSIQMIGRTVDKPMPSCMLFKRTVSYFLQYYFYNSFFQRPCRLQYANTAIALSPPVTANSAAGAFPGLKAFRCPPCWVSTKTQEI